MSSNILNQAPFLRTTRSFPQEVSLLSVEIDRAYVDIANILNNRTIGMFPVNKPIVNGESWFLAGPTLRQQALRQVYQFTGTGSIPHGINNASVSQFTKCSGEFTDGTNYYGAIFGSNTAIAGQVSFYVTPTNLVIISGGGAPTIVSGLIVLEWLSRV